MSEGLGQSFQSARNRIFWRLRANLKFRRPGYRETGAESLLLSREEQALEKTYSLSSYRKHLSTPNYRKNLFTLWALERLLAPELKGFECTRVLEPGCQDFSRFPALASFLQASSKAPKFFGLELDPFPILSDLHSRWDKANYYISLGGAQAEYQEADFFAWNRPADLILCFYPFVSEHPALAWGLPSSFGQPQPWVRSFERNLRPGGLLFVVHQGEWEEEEFDAARTGARLSLLRRESLNCPFFPLEHSACASVYRNG